MIELPHIGFCLGEYDKDTCSDCPTLKECLELRDRERVEYERQNKTLQGGNHD